MKKTFLLTSMFMMALTSTIAASNKPTLSRVNASPFIGQVQEYNNAGAQGPLYTVFGTSGSLSIDTQLSGGQAQAIQVLTDGSFLVALSKTATNSVIAKYNAQGAVVGTSTYGSSGIANLGSATAVARAMMIDSQGRALVAGGNDATSGTAGWLKRVSADGDTVTSFTTGTAWQFIGGIAQQTTGKIIVVGSNNTNAQIARYTTAGALDTTFGTAGTIIFDGTNGLTATTGLYNVVVDGDDNIYVAYLQGTAAKVAKFNASGVLVSDFGTAGMVAITYLDSATASQMRMAMDYAAELVIAASLTSTVRVTSIETGAGTAGAIADFSTSVFTSLSAVVPTSDGKVLLIGSDTVSPFNMAVMRLTSFGDLDSSTETNNVPFNTTGYNLFNVSTPTVAAVLHGAAIAPDGQLYTVGYQSTGGTPTVTPYVSVLFNAPYVSAIPQFPATVEQGTLDETFGNNATQSFRGVTMPYNGFFGQSLQQQTRAIVELSSGNLLIGSDGLTNSSATQTMMLTWLTAAGVLDTVFGSNGKLTLPNVTASAEQMAALAVGGSGYIYIAGTSGTPTPFLRSYNSAGSAISTMTDTGTGSVGIAVQGTAGILLFAQDSSTTGHISRYTSSTGTLALDTGGFGTSGKIATTALGLNMGPVYGGGLVNEAADIIIAYKNSSNSNIDLAMINKNGTALIPEFGTNGIISNVFSSSAILATNVRTAFDNFGNIVVAAVNAAGTAYLMRRYNGVTGAPDTTFNGGAILTITPETSPIVLSLTNLTGMSNGAMMLTGYDQATDPVMLTLRVTSVGVLDTTFNAQASVPGVLPMQIEDATANYAARVATGLAIQSSTGNLVYSAYESQTSSPAQSTPEVMRAFGQSGTTQVQRFPTQDQNPGTLDLSLNSCGAMNIASLTAAGQAKIVYAYPADSAHEGKILLGVDTGASIIMIRVDETTLAFDTTFNTTGSLTIGSLTGLNNIMVDNQNRIIINGTQAGNGWARMIPDNGATAPIAFMMPTDISSANMIYQQQSGRFIVAGSTSSIGVLVAFQDQLVGNNSGLAVDTTFNPLAVGGIAGRWNVTGSTSLYSLVINYDDTILVAYLNSTVQVAKLLANGSGLVTTFGTSGVKDTAITPSSASVIRVASNSNSSSSAKVIVAAATSTGLSVVRYLTAGTVDATWNSTGAVTTITGLGSAGVALKSLLVTENNQTVLVGSATTGTTHGRMFAVRLSSAGILDTTWNPSPTSPDVAGILTFGAIDNPLDPAITIMSNATIGIDGNILAVGGDGTAPILMEIIGDSYVNAVNQGQFAGAAGTLDATIFESTGALNVNTVSGALLGNARKLYIYPDGSMIMASNYTGSLTKLTKLLATLALDTSFSTDGLLSLSNAAIVNDMFVSNNVGDNGAIYTTGANAGSLWAATVSATGTPTSVTIPTSMSAWTQGTAIRKASNDDIIVAGFDGTHGAVAAFSPAGNALDPLFATAGVYATTSTNPIAAMTVDNQSRIYIAYLVSGATTTIAVKRLTAEGIIDTTFSGSILGTAWSATQIKLQLDQNNNQVVLAAQDGTSAGNSLTVARFSTVDGSATGITTAVTIASKVLALSDLFIDSNQEIYVIGTNTTDSKAVVARLVSVNSTTIALDTANFATTGTPGIANVAITGPIAIGAGGLDPDRRVYLAGYDGATPAVPYLSRLFGDNYYRQVSQAVPGFAPGQFDVTYGTGGIATTTAGVTDADGQQARAIVPLATGTKIMTVIANADGTASWTARLLSNGANDTSYTNGAEGNGIIITQISTGTEVVQGMVFDGSNNSIVFGSNSLHGGYVKSILPIGNMNQDFGANTPFPAGTVYFAQFDSINAVAQLTSGNFVCVGSLGNDGKIGMIDAQGTLVQSFGNNGFVTIGANVTSVSVDSSNNIYASVGTLVDDVVSASVVKLSSTGSYISVFGTLGIAANVLTGLDDVANIRMVFDGQGNIIVAGSDEDSAIKVIRLLPTGIVDTTFTALTVPFSGTSAVVTSLAALQNGNTLVAGYQYDSVDSNNNDYEFVISILSTGSLDTTFNSAGTTPGLLTFQVASGDQEMRNIWAMGVQSDGQILLAGSEDSTSDVSTSSTMRVDGYVGESSIPQFTGAVPTPPNPLNPNFGDNGIAFTTVISNLHNGGSTAVDSQNRVLLGGITGTAPNCTFVVARFLTDGTLDTTFSSDGIAQTPTLSTLLSGSFISIDSNDNAYIGGITSDAKVIVAKFLASNGALDTAGFNSAGTGTSVAGVAVSAIITNLTSGGYTAVDSHNRIVVGGMTSDFKLAVARFTSAGVADTTFSGDGAAVTGVISTLQSGGYITTSLSTTDSTADNVYLGASTHADTLLIAKFTSAGILDSSFGTDGIAQTGQLTHLTNGGPIALDSNLNLVVGGYTADKIFVVARFLPTGVFDPAFSTDGIALSNPLSSLDACAGICVDANDNILAGGTSTAADGTSMSMVIARWTVEGLIDVKFAPSGIVTTGTITGLVSGGFTATNAYQNPFAGGYAGTKLVVAEMYTGLEIIIPNPSALPTAVFKIYWYGNNPTIFKDFLGIALYVLVITDLVIRAEVIARLNTILDEYADLYGGQPDINLVACTPLWDAHILKVELELIADYPAHTVAIRELFNNFNKRRRAISLQLGRYSMVGVGGDDLL